MVSARIGASTPRDGWSWRYGLVNICAENSAHERLLELVARFPCHLSESSRRTQTDQSWLERVENYKERLTSLLLCKDYAGAAVLKSTFRKDAEAAGRDAAAVVAAAQWRVERAACWSRSA